VLWLAGVLAVAWVAWGWIDARIYQRQQERLLASSLVSETLEPVEGDEGRGPSTPATAGAPGAPVASDDATESDDDPIGIPADELATAAVSAPTSRETSAGGAATDVSARDGAMRVVAADASARRRAERAAMPKGESLGRIVVPRLGIAVMVGDGIDNRTLRRSVGHIPGTSRLGSGGNVGLAGHRDSFFRPLKDVRPGDEVLVTTPGAISRYRVEWAEVVPPGDTSSLRATTYPALTLVTCHPFYYVGTAPDRFVVRARLIESRAATAADAALLRAGRGR
jgi:LPXTG-site transpeptidase (sortase) family protein